MLVASSYAAAIAGAVSACAPETGSLAGRQERQEEAAAVEEVRQVIWRRQSDDWRDADCSQKQTAIVATAAVVTKGALIVELHHAMQVVRSNGLMAVHATVMRNHQPYAQLKQVGIVEGGTRADANVSIALDRLPDGDLEIVLYTDDSMYDSLFFKKSGSAIVAQRYDEQDGVVNIPANPKYGLPAAVAIVESSLQAEVRQ